jgi:uncharacterized protein
MPARKWGRSRLTTVSTKPRARGKRVVAVTARWLHIYLSMASFTLVFFFAATGLTLNHPDWFSSQKTVESHGVLPKTTLADKLAVVEAFRAHDHVHGGVTDFRVDDAQVSVSFRAPGYTADAFIDRGTGKYDLTVVQSSFVAVMNDLHKGRDAGKAWGVLIDISAVLLVLVSLTGLILIWFIYRRRTSGLLLAGLATVCFLVLWHFAV